MLSDENMISSQQLGERLADARKCVKLTQAQLGERLDVARTTVVAMEKGERRPSNAELVKLAVILGVEVHDLLREGLVRVEVSPRFRMGSAGRDAAPIQEALERLRLLGGRYVELERLHGLHRVRAPLETLQTYRVELGAPSGVDAKLEGEDAARTVRGMLGLGDEPALEIDDRFETEAGLRVFYLDRLPPKLAAFLLWSDESGACVAINRAHPVERQRWSLTHEVGHFLRDREAGDVLENGDSFQQPTEIFPEAFAKEFLLPTSGVRKRFTERCRSGKFTPIDLHTLARTFGVSFQAMALRLEELRLLPKGSYEKIVQSRLKPQDLGPREAAERPSLLRLGLPERYVALAVSAYDQEMLSEGEFAEMLSTDVATARAVFQEHERIPLGDGTQLRVDFTGADLRLA
jgi:Zn-dependent peptidase ImmA (M78 family)/transcriptional regulator with XRE-family HTH domain